MLKIGVIGYGYWGSNLVRNFFEKNSCVIKYVSDLRIDRLTILKKYYPSITPVNDPSLILNDAKIDAVVIATPVVAHYEIAKKALESGKHVLVEKPMTTSLGQAQELVRLAKKSKKILMVDHTFLYTDAIRKIKKIIDDKKLGQINYFDSVRTNLGLFQQDVNVLWDLASHDVSILCYLFTRKAKTIQASGVSHTKNGIENIAFLTIKYDEKLIAHINCSWSTPVKIRLILIGGTKKMIVYNDVEPSEKIRIYDAGYSLRQSHDTGKFQVDYRIGDIHLPKIDLQEALSLMAADFISAVKKDTKPVSNAELGLEVVKILSLAEKSLKNNERPVDYK